MPLVENNLFGHVDKVQIAIDRLKAFEPKEGYLAILQTEKKRIDKPIRKEVIPWQKSRLHYPSTP